jgi:hypothetical protein
MTTIFRVVGIAYNTFIAVIRTFIVMVNMFIADHLKRKLKQLRRTI